MPKQARKRPAKRKNQMPEWVNPNFKQPTKSTRTHTKGTPTTKRTGGKTKWAGRTKKQGAIDVLGIKTEE